VPWVTIGDATFTDLGLWTATAANAGTWNRRSLYGEVNNGSYEYGINFIPVTIEGQTVVILEYDGYGPSGPLLHATQDPTKTRPTKRLFDLPAPYSGSMRSLTLTSEGNLMWVTTSESGASGSVESVWISRPPFRDAVLLEAVSNLTEFGTLGDPVENGNYIWFGTSLVRKEKFRGQ
jgi:hypothetical protein